MAERVCAVVVTYNRKNLLLECLEALRKQTRPIDAIYLIDNASSDGTPEMLLGQGYILELPPTMLSEPWEIEQDIPNLKDGQPIRVHYVRMHANTGGAGGFYEGMKRAYERGYDWFWLMDDDAEPEETALEGLEQFFGYEGVAALCTAVRTTSFEILGFTRSFLVVTGHGLVQKPSSEQLYESEVPFSVDMASFVGILVSRQAVTQVGFPNKDFFVYHDDLEYSMRLKNYGKIWVIPRSIMFHKETRAKHEISKRFFNLSSKRIPYNRFWLEYYRMRNCIYLNRIYAASRVKFLFRVLKGLVKSLVEVLMYDDCKFRRTLLLLLAVYDGLRGSFDNSRPHYVLYGRRGNN